MNTYLVLLRGINVGGKNKIPMTDLRTCLEDIGFKNVITYIQSGNIILQSEDKEDTVQAKIEKILPAKFVLDSSIIKALVITPAQLTTITDKAPSDFGKEPNAYRHDVLFAMGVDPREIIEQFKPREGVDEVWLGESAVYVRRPAINTPNATRSRLGQIAQVPVYKSITIRNWNTVTKLLALLEEQPA